MKKVVLKLLSMMLVYVMFIVILSSGVYAVSSSNDSFTLNIDFDNHEYITNSKFYAELYLTDIADEVASGAKLGALNVHFSYDASVMVYIDYSLYVEELYDADIFEVTSVEISGKNVINLMFVFDEAITFEDIARNTTGAEIDDDRKIYLVDFKFKVIGEPGDNLSVSFEDVSLGENHLPYSASAIDENTDPYEILLNNSQSSSDVISGTALVKYGELHYGPRNIRAFPEVEVLDTSAVLIVKLIDASNKMLLDAPKVFQLKNGKNFLDDFIEFECNDMWLTYDDNIEVQYYVWDSMLSCKCLNKTFVYRGVK